MSENRYILDFFAVTVALVTGLSAVSHVASAAETYAIRAKKVYTASHGVIENGIVVVQSGKIIAVGSHVTPPPGARELTAYAVIPGLVDIHSHIAQAGDVDELNENAKGNPVTPQVRAMDAFDYRSPAIERARAGGVTTIVLRPGSANVIGGASVALKLKDAPTDRMVLKEPADIKMALDTVLGRSFEGSTWAVPGYPRPNSTVENFRALANEAFQEAQEYDSRWQAYERERKAGSAATPPGRDLGLDTLVKALRREIPVHFHCTGDSDGSPAAAECVRLADTFNLRITLAHAVDPVFHLDQFGKRRDIHFNVGPALFVADKSNPMQFKNAPAILANAGLKVSLETDAPVSPQQSLRDMATLTVRYGMREEDALRAITLHGAEAIGLEDRIGSIDPGKDADLVLLNGEPFEFATAVEKVLIDGKIAYEHATVSSGVAQLPVAQAQRSLRLPSRLASTDRFAIRGGTILTIAGPPIRNGTILISHGKIEQIGQDVRVPRGIPVIDASDFFLMPGLISGRSQAGLSHVYSGVQMPGEGFSTVARSIFPQRDIELDIDQEDPIFVMARMLGVTSVLVTPGDRYVMGGHGLVIKTAGSAHESAFLSRRAVAMFNLGDAAKLTGEMPATRMGIVAVLRQALLDAQAYRNGSAGHTQEGDEDPSKAAAMEALFPVLDGKIAVMFHCDLTTDVWTALRIADEFNLKIIVTGAVNIDSATAIELARRGVPVVLELKSERSESPAVLAKAGVVVAFTRAEGFYRRSADGTWQIVHPAGMLGGDLLEIAARAYGSGMPEEAALRAITLDAAKIIGVDHRVGSLEAGKDADIVILPGHPLRASSIPQLVLINGRPVYQLEPDAWVIPPEG